MMVRFYIRFILLQFIMFAAVLMVTHAQPNTDDNLRQLLLPDNCPAPCFMGIRPGVTTEDEAVQILKSSGWTADIQMQPTSRWIFVRWNAKAPMWLTPSKGNYHVMMALRNSLIDEIHVSTTLRLADTEFLLGRPSAIDITLFTSINRDNHDVPRLNYSAAYTEDSMLVSLSEYCKGDTRITHQMPDVVLSYYSDMKKQADLLSQYQYSWRNVLDTRC